MNAGNQHIDLEASRETNKNEMRQLQIANDNLQFAEAKLDEANKLVKQRYIAAMTAKADVEKKTLDATTGKTLEAKQTAIGDTAELSAGKKSYLDIRDLYSDSTKLVAQYKSELKDAKAATAIAFAAYNTKKTEADEAKVKADKAAVAKEQFEKTTSTVPEVGEETTPDAVARAQQMGQISAKAKQAEIEAQTLMHQASDMKAVWESKVGLQKTAQETFDAEVKRNAELSIKSNQEQKKFIDASHVAAVEATASADIQKKQKDLLLQASKSQGNAESLLEVAQKEAHRLARIVDVRRVERDSQKAKAEAANAALALHTAMFEVAQKQVGVELNKEQTNRDATVATLKANFDAAKLKAANAKKTADQIRADAQADGIRLETLRAVDNMVKLYPASDAATVSDPNASKSNGDTGVVSNPNEMFDGSASVASTGAPQDNVNRFLKTFNLLMMGDGTDTVSYTHLTLPTILLV